MRGFRSTLILLVIFLALVGYVYFYDSKRPPGPATEVLQKVFSVENDQIEEISVKTQAGEPTVIKKVNGSWEITAPISAAADQNEATGLATNLTTLEIQRVVDENPADAGQYGLAAPPLEIGFRKAGETAFTSIQIGDKTPTGADLYARLPSEKRVFLISSYLESTFNKTAFDLRDKTILKFERDKIDAVEITAGPARTTIAHAGAEWRLTAPIEARADTATVDGLVGRLQAGQMKSIAMADAAAADLAQYGLDRPSVSVALAAGSARATLAIGKEADAGSFYARDASRPMVFTVESSLVDDFKRNAEAYRPKDVFEFRPFSASRIEIARNGSTEAFEKKPGKDGADQWHRVEPAGEVDSAKMDSFLASLSGLSVDGYVDGAAAAGPTTAEVFVTFDQGQKQERVTFAKVGSDAFASRPGEPGAGKFAAARLDDALKALDALK